MICDVNEAKRIFDKKQTALCRIVRDNQRFWHQKVVSITQEGQVRILYQVGNSYSVQASPNGPALWYITPERYEGGARKESLFFAHTVIDMNGASVYQNALKTPFLATNKVNPQAYLENAGFTLLRFQIEDIQQKDVRDLDQAELQSLGYHDANVNEALFRFWEHWTAKHDKSFRFWFDSRIADYMWYVNRRQMNQGLADVGGWERLQEVVRSRPNALYTAWFFKVKVG